MSTPKDIMPYITEERPVRPKTASALEDYLDESSCTKEKDKTEKTVFNTAKGSFVRYPDGKWRRLVTRRNPAYFAPYNYRTIYDNRASAKYDSPIIVRFQKGISRTKLTSALKSLLRQRALPAFNSEYLSFHEYEEKTWSLSPWPRFDFVDGVFVPYTERKEN